MIIGIITAAMIVGAVGIFIGIFLGIAGLKFKVEVDEREEALLATLPGNNCGGCGYAGCSGLASAIAKGEADIAACPVGGESVSQKLASIMGLEANGLEAKTAFVHCQGDCEKTQVDYEYYGIEDCRMLQFVPNGGPKSCNNGCLGFGTCAKICPFNAIDMINGIAKINKEKCKACGKCIDICPKHLISFIPDKAKQVVACSSTDKGPITMKVCTVGCIGCGLCTKVCVAEAIKVENFHAIIDHAKCTGCGACTEKCPKKSIVIQ